MGTVVSFDGKRGELYLGLDPRRRFCDRNSDPADFRRYQQPLAAAAEPKSRRVFLLSVPFGRGCGSRFSHYTF